MNSTLFRIVGIAIIAYIAYVLWKIYDEGVVWGWLSPILFVVGLFVDHRGQSLLGVFFVAVAVVVLICAHIYIIQAHKREDKRIRQKYMPTASNRYSRMPSDAHGQVEALARFINIVYKSDSNAKNSFAKGHLYLYKDNNGICTLDFWYDWDYGPAESIVRENYELDPRIAFESSDMIHYQTNNVDRFDWIIHPMTNAFYLEPVIATLQNECPGLRITQREILSTGIHVAFDYR